VLAGGGCLSESELTRQAGAGLVGTQGACELDDVRGGRNVIEVELGDTCDVVKHSGELASHGLDLLVAQRKTGETGDMEDLITGDHSGAF
jgi:hypothetical protein